MQVLVLLSGGASGWSHVLNGNVNSVVHGGTDPISEGWFGFVAHVMLPQRGATFSCVSPLGLQGSFLNLNVL